MCLGICDRNCQLKRQVVCDGKEWGERNLKECKITHTRYILYRYSGHAERRVNFGSIKVICVASYSKQLHRELSDIHNVPCCPRHFWRMIPAEKCCTRSGPALLLHSTTGREIKLSWKMLPSNGVKCTILITSANRCGLLH